MRIILIIFKVFWWVGFNLLIYIALLYLKILINFFVSELVTELGAFCAVVFSKKSIKFYILVTLFVIKVKLTGRILISNTSLLNELFPLGYLADFAFCKVGFFMSNLFEFYCFCTAAITARFRFSPLTLFEVASAYHYFTVA